MVLERFTAGFEDTRPLPLSHLAASMRCILQALFAFDVYGQHFVNSSSSLTVILTPTICLAAALGQGSSPILALEHMDWCMTAGQADDVRAV